MHFCIEIFEIQWNFFLDLLWRSYCYPSVVYAMHKHDILTKQVVFRATKWGAGLVEEVKE